MISPSDEENEEHDEWSHFPSIALLTDDDDDDHEATTNSKDLQILDSNQYQRPPSIRRDWGIPTFQDQIDRGVRTFQLQRLEHENGDKVGVSTARPIVIIHLEHRLHSTGSDLWDSALVLAHALPRVLPVILQPMEWMKWRSHYQSYRLDNNNLQEKSIGGSSRSMMKATNGMTVLELGSGTGAVGLYCYKCLRMKEVILTDLRDNLSLIRKNCLANQIVLKGDYSEPGDDNVPYPSNVSSTVSDTVSDPRLLHSHLVSVCALDWTDPILPPRVVTAIQEQGVDLIVGSDLFLPFAPDLLVHLAERLAQILSLCHDHLLSRVSAILPSTDNAAKMATVPVAILAYEERFDCSNFFTRAKSLNLNVEEIDSAWLHPTYQDAERIRVLRITFMPPS